MVGLGQMVASFFRKARPPVGSRPGTLAPPSHSPPPEIHLCEYSEGELHVRKIEEVEELTAFVDPPRTTWIDVRGLGDEDVLHRIGEIFDLHPLALADAVNVPQRAKADSYPSQKLVIARMPLVDADGTIDVPQVALFIGPRYLLTFQERFFGCFEPVRERLRAAVGPIRSAGPDYLAYALIDTLVDSYYPVVEALANELEDIEEDVIDLPDGDVLGRIHRNRRRLVVLRRVGRPQREAIHCLVREESPFIGESVRTYFRDTYDHVCQIVDLIDSSHEMSVGLMEIYLSTLSHRTNEVMKMLTLMASIFIPLTFLAGIYGMNFEFMPELHREWAYPAVLFTMGGVAGAMLLYFRRRGWIGSPKRKRDDP